MGNVACRDPARPPTRYAHLSYRFKPSRLVISEHSGAPPLSLPPVP